MKICYIVPNIESNDGIAKHCREFIEHLPSSVEYRAVTPVGVAAAQDYHLPVISFSPLSLISAYKQIVAMRPDIIHVHFAVPAYGVLSLHILFLVVMLRRVGRFRIVVSLHEVKRELELLGFVARYTYVLLHHISDELFVHSRNAKHLLSKRCAIREQKIYVTSLGMPQQKRSDSTSDPKRLVFFGYVHIHKGLDVFVRAVHRLLQTHPSLREEISCVIAGDVRPRKSVFRFFEWLDYRYKGKIVRLIEEYQLGKVVTLAGFVPEAKLDDLFQKAGVFVLPYVNAEQSGVVHRILPYGLPIVASDIGGLGELLSGSGLLFPPGDDEQMADVLYRAITDKDLRRSCKKRYSEIVKEHSMDNIISGTMKEYRSLL